MTRFLSLIVMLASTALADDPAARSVSPIQRSRNWTNVFSGQQSRLAMEVQSTVPGMVTWSLSAGRAGAVIQRGQRQVPGSQTIELELTFPEVAAGQVLPATLIVELATTTGEKSRQAFPFHVFSSDVITTRSAWFKSLKLELYDPAGTTGPLLTGAQIPFRRVDRPGDPGGDGVLIQGSGIDPARRRAHWEAALSAAASGRRVVVLASAGGQVPLNLLAEGPVQANQVVWRHRFSVPDPRIDVRNWPAPKVPVALSAHWTVDRGSAVMEFRDDDRGWAGLEVRFPNGGCLIWSAAGIVDAWDVTPAARYGLIELIEQVSETHSEGVEHVETRAGDR